MVLHFVQLKTVGNIWSIASAMLFRFALLKRDCGSNHATAVSCALLCQAGTVLQGTTLIIPFMTIRCSKA